MSLRNPKEEMSMEEILSSIRKYVAEEDGNANKPENLSQDNSTEPVITLGQDDIAVDKSDDEEYAESSIGRGAYINKATYEETSSLAMELAQDSAKRSRPFDRLADAFDAYGRNKSKRKGQNVGEMTVEQLVRSITEKMVGEWVETHLRNIVEELVMREIEKIKSE
jgi:cell pole-organizing protein PopZ